MKRGGDAPELGNRSSASGWACGAAWPPQNTMLWRKRLTRKEAWIILPDQCETGKLEAYQQLAQAKAEGEEQLAIHQVSEVSGTDLENRSFYLLGTQKENSLYRKISVETEAGFSIQDQLAYLNGKPVPGPLK